MKQQRLRSERDTAGDTAPQSPAQLKPYAIIDPIAYAALVSRRRYRRTKWRHTTNAVLEHPLNEHEYRRAARTGSAYAAVLAAAVLVFALVWGWLSFSWDALRVTAAARRERPGQAWAVVEETLVLAAVLTLAGLMMEGWAPVRGVEGFVAFVLLVFPLACAFVMRREIQWCSDASEKNRPDEASHSVPPLMLGETASPPGLTRARETRGDERA